MVTMSSLDRRLAAVERRRMSRPPRPSSEELVAEAEDAWEEGTATLDQFRLFQSASARAALLRPLLSYGYFEIAKEKAGDKRDTNWYDAFWYPPDSALPREVRKHLKTAFELADASLDQWRRWEGRYTPLESTIARRQIAVNRAACLEDHQARTVRRRVWQADGDRWVPSDEIIMLARNNWLTVGAGDSLLGSIINQQLFADLIESGRVTLPARPDGIPEDHVINLYDFTEAYIRLELGESRGNATWSDQVRSGHKH